MSPWRWGQAARRASRGKRWRRLCHLALPVALAASIGAAGPAPASQTDAAPLPAAGNYPPSTFITGVRWDARVQRAGCGDNLPITWADDNALYTAFGDCWGFTPGVPRSLTIARIADAGNPYAFVGSNQASLPLQFGSGPRGRKASGLLMVNHVLYMLVRNAYRHGEQAQLAWSRDHGNTWTYAPWTFTTSFGYPVFLNFGENYQGARDGFVYIYSPDSANAYAPATEPARQGMVLARVPKAKLTQQTAYTYFVRLEHGRPKWSSAIDRRGLVFQCRRVHCLRSQISYDAPLQRYLWWQQAYVTTADTRQQGGFGIYESPTPWGPWRTIYFNSDWQQAVGDAPGEDGVFPTKWLSRDGKTLYLVYSARNAFSVRRVILTTSGQRS